MKELLNPALDDTDGTFWMSVRDFYNNFYSVNICHVRNWDEVRIKGKFIRVQDIEDLNIEVVLSKWYYSLELTKKTKIIIGIH